MDKFINTHLLSAAHLEAFLSCCDARAQAEGFSSWKDPNLPPALKKTIVLNCIEACAFPVEVLK